MIQNQDSNLSLFDVKVCSFSHDIILTHLHTGHVIFIFIFYNNSQYEGNLTIGYNEYIGFLLCLQEGMGQEVAMKTKNVVFFSGSLRPKKYNKNTSCIIQCVCAHVHTPTPTLHICLYIHEGF